MNAQIDILNVGAGHIEIRFDEKDPIETVRAKRIVTDMLKRGYALFVQGQDKTMCRVQRFDAAAGVYIIADGPGLPEEVEPETEHLLPKVKGIESGLKSDTHHVHEKRGPGRPRKIKMEKSKVTAVGRSAGG